MRPALAALLTVLALLPGVAPAGAEPGDEGVLRGTLERPPAVVTGPSAAAQVEVADNFELVGHSPLGARGMNAAIAFHEGFAYVGSRTDGRPHHRTPGILVVDARAPAAPAVVTEVTEGLAGDGAWTSRELRVWPQQDLLIVLEFTCSAILHACTPGGEVQGGSAFELFDLTDPAAPRLIATAEPSRTPHEFFLWVDPHQPDERALLFWSTPNSTRTEPNLVVTDISAARAGGPFPEIPWVADFPAPQLPDGGGEADRRLHSIGVTPDGRTTYLAFLGAGFLVLDSSEIVDAVPAPRFHLLTPPGSQPVWSDPGAHSAVRIPGTDTVLITDEVYGDALDPVVGQDHGCPWGWVRIADARDPADISIVSEYRIAENDPAYCEELVGGSPANTLATSYAAHNPTLTGELAFITWHSGGLQAIDLRDPLAPRPAGMFKPEPLPTVATEDPALSLGMDKVVMWSYPVIVDGLIYVVDLRNGLYVLRYTGPTAAQVDEIAFLEGNSNLGDALRLDPPAPAAAGVGGSGGRAATVATALALLLALTAARAQAVGRRRLSAADQDSILAVGCISAPVSQKTGGCGGAIRR